MSTASATQRTIAASLAFILVSCSATRQSVTGPTGPQDLTRYALIIKSQPDGQVTNEWAPISEFNLADLGYHVSINPQLEGNVVRIGTLEAYCAGRLDSCINFCKSSIGPIRVEDEEFPDTPDQWWVRGKNWCQGVCTKNHAECMSKRGRWYEERPRNFTRLDNAIDWLKRHRTEVLVGTVIVVAGVALVAVSAAAAGGALVLVPLVLLASDGPPDRGSQVFGVVGVQNEH